MLAGVKFGTLSGTLAPRPPLSSQFRRSPRAEGRAATLHTTPMNTCLKKSSVGARCSLAFAGVWLLLSSFLRADCITASSGGAWADTPFTAQSGTFTATFDATPSNAPTNSVIALSNGAQTAYASFACLVRFNPSGQIDARNGANYAGPASPISYAAGVTYHFRLVVNVGAQTYSIYVTPSGGSELTVGTNFAFRVAASSLNYWGVYVDSGASGGVGSTTVCSFSLGTAAAPTFSPAAGAYTGTQTVSITTSTSGASIRYTTDGSTPSETAGVLYAGPVSISSTTTLKAIAYAAGYNDSTVSSGTYTIGTGSGGLSGTSSDGFHSIAMSSAQSGSFTATCDATPSASPENAVIGLSRGAATAYTAYSCIVRFNPSGNIDAYNSTGYSAAATIPYSAGATYHFRFVVNVPANTYSIYVTPPGGAEQTVGLNYGFRASQTSLDTWGLDVNASPAGCALTATNLSVTANSGGGLDPTVAPGGNFDLSIWTLQLPILDSNGNIMQVYASQLEGPNGFQDQYFYTNTTTGAMEFWVPENGAHTANSSYPRSELREAQPGGDWFLPGTHTMTATVVVNDTVGTVTIGQIHLGTQGTPSSTKPLLELQCTTSGNIQLFLETSPSGGGASHFITNVPLGHKFDYMIKLVGNTITIMANGVTQTFAMDSSYNSEDFYFKAGAYLQTTGSSSSLGAHVSFYALRVVHQ
jgi:hypothetical protein